MLYICSRLSQIIEPRYTSNTSCSNFRGIQDQFYHFPCTCGYKLHLRQISTAPYRSIVLLSPKCSGKSLIPKYKELLDHSCLCLLNQAGYSHFPFLFYEFILKSLLQRNMKLLFPILAPMMRMTKYLNKRTEIMIKYVLALWSSRFIM